MTRHNSRFLAVAVIVVLGALRLTAQAQTTQPQTTQPKPAPLVLTGAIPLPGVQGRIDHLAIDPKGRLFISALGNNSVEVLDLAAGIRTHSTTGIPKPQGVAYAQEFKKLFVGSDEGKLYIYDGDSYRLITSLDFGDDVDNLRYDAASKHLLRWLRRRGRSHCDGRRRHQRSTSQRVQTRRASRVLPTRA